MKTIGGRKTDFHLNLQEGGMHNKADYKRPKHTCTMVAEETEGRRFGFRHIYGFKDTLKKTLLSGCGSIFSRQPATSGNLK